MLRRDHMQAMQQGAEPFVPGIWLMFDPMDVESERDYAVWRYEEGADILVIINWRGELSPAKISDPVVLSRFHRVEITPETLKRLEIAVIHNVWRRVAVKVWEELTHDRA